MWDVNDPDRWKKFNQQAPELSEGAQLDRQLDNFVEERGTTMDIFHDLWVGTGQALDIFGRAVGGDGATGQWIQETSFAKPDASQYFGTQGRVGRVVDMVAQSIPTTLSVVGAGAVGTAVAGPVGGYVAGATTLAAIGKGTFDQSYEEIQKESPELDDKDKFKYALVNALAETGSEAVGAFGGFLIGKTISKPAKNALLKNIMKKNLISPEDLVATMVKNSDPGRLVKGVFGSAAADGGSEVINELVQAANKQEHGVDVGELDLIDVFLAGALPGASITAGTAGFDMTTRNRVKANIEAGLKSEDPRVREHSYNQVKEGLGKIHSDFVTLWEEKVDIGQPIDLNSSLEKPTEAEVIKEVIENPEKILEEAGITTEDTVATEDTVVTEGTPDEATVTEGTPDEATVNEGTPDEATVTEGTPEETLGIPEETLGIPEETGGKPEDILGIPEETLGIPGTPEETLGTPDETKGTPRDLDIYTDNMMEREGLSAIVSEGTNRGVAVQSGIKEVIEAEKKLESSTDLKERAKLKADIKRTRGLIQEETGVTRGKDPLVLKDGSTAVYNPKAKSDRRVTITAPDGTVTTAASMKALRDDSFLPKRSESYMKEVGSQMSDTATNEIYSEIDDLGADPVKAMEAFEEKYKGQEGPYVENLRRTIEFEIDSNPEIAAASFESKFKNANDLMKGVLEKGTDRQKVLATEILNNPIAAEKLSKFPIEFNKAGQSYFNPAEGVAVGVTSITRPEVWLHEASHAVTSQEVRENKEVRDKVRELMDIFKQSVKLSKEQLAFIEKAKGNSQYFNENYQSVEWNSGTEQVLAYALLNESEFLAQAHSSTSVQNAMREITYETKISIWDKFMELVGDVFGLPKDKISLLEQTFNVSKVAYVQPVKNYLAADMAVTDNAMSTEAIDKATRITMSKPKPKLQPLREKSKEISKFLKEVTVPISDAIGVYSKKVYAKLMTMEAGLISKQKEYSQKAKPFMKWYTSLSKSQQTALDYGLFNDNQETWDNMPKEVRGPLKELLDDLGNRAVDVGLLEKIEGLYFPRRVHDKVGLADKYLKKFGVSGAIGVALKERADQLGVTVEELNNADRNTVITDMLQSGEVRQLPKPGGTKSRSVETVTPDVYEFYESASDSLLGHIFEMNEKISLREFVGGSRRKKKMKELSSLVQQIDNEKDPEILEELTSQHEALYNDLSNLEKDLEDGIAQVIQEELGDAPADVQQEVFSMLDARMKQRGASGVIDTFRNVGYIATMGNFLSAITQLGDIPIVFYRYGFNKDTVKSVVEAFGQIAKVAMRDISGKDVKTDAFVDAADFTNALREFSSGNKLSAKSLEFVFKYSGLKFSDLIGKEASMRSSFKHYQNPKNKDKFMEKYEPFFGKDTAKVYQDIQLGKKNDDVRNVLIAELAEFQPVTMSNQSQKYLKAGNMRAFYMLKTFTLRTTNAAIREAMVSIRKGKYAEGAAKFSSILLIYSLAGAGTDELKDLIRGRESSFTDNTMDNMLQMAFLSKYTVSQGIQRDRLVTSFFESLLPPMRYADDFGADAVALLSNEKDYKYKATKNIPFVGNIIYSRSDAGQETRFKREKDEILEKVRENAKKRKGARTGGISDMVRKYNRSAPKELRITDRSLMQSYRRAKKTD